MADIYAGGKFALSFEVFPPKSAEGMTSLWSAIDRLREFDPGFISCTYGAGGTTRDQTLEIIAGIKSRDGQTATAHFTCVGSTVAELRDWLRKAQAAGADNIMALRGDPPAGQSNFKPVAGGLRYASELVKLIRDEFPNFGIGVAGYPETHQEATSPQSDLENLKRKVDVGGEAVFTQLYYDNADFFAFRDRCDKIGVRKPIIPGLLPILNLAQIQRITKLCKARLPEELVRRLEASADDPAAQTEVGIEHASKQCEELLRAGVPGIHFYVLNKHEATTRILRNVSGLLPVAAGG